MPRSGNRRRVATVLFLDIVGSTALASELGDARWRELLARFRRTVRMQLRRGDGREQDTAGDGFFATFREPGAALTAAAAITSAVQELGIDVRAGIHVGECEEIDGKLGGIAAHIGARTMSLAGPAEVLVTRTVRELAAGSRASFAERGAHELKGVEGLWDVYALRSVETPLPPPLSSEEAAARLGTIQPSTPRRRMGIAAGALVAVAAAVVVPLLFVGGGTAGSAAAATLIRIDGRDGKVVGTVRDRSEADRDPSALWSVNGTLWQLSGRSPNTILVERDLGSGTAKQRFGAGAGAAQPAFGFGSIWLLRNTAVVSGPNAGTFAPAVARLDELTGRLAATIQVPGALDPGSVAVGNGAVWVLESDGTLDRIDPLTNHVTARYPTGAIETTTLIPLDGFDWICECQYNRVRRFDPRTHRSRTFTIPAQAYLIGLDTTRGVTLWLLDPGSATLTPLDPRTGKSGTPLGLSGDPQQAVVADGSVWAAAGSSVDRVSLQTRDRTEIALPHGTWATSIAADPATGTIWVGNDPAAAPSGT